MKTKTSFTKLLQLWGIIFLIAVGVSITPLPNTSMSRTNPSKTRLKSQPLDASFGYSCDE